MLREASGLRAAGNQHVISFANGTQIASRTVVLAMGAHYQRLGIPSLEALVGAGVYYGGGITEAQAMAGQQVFVAGGGNSAGQAAVHMAKYAAHVTVLVRGSSLAASMSDYLVQEIAAADNIEVRLRTNAWMGTATGGWRASCSKISPPKPRRQRRPAPCLSSIGAQPHTTWLPKEIASTPRLYSHRP